MFAETHAFIYPGLAIAVLLHSIHPSQCLDPEDPITRHSCPGWSRDIAWALWYHLPQPRPLASDLPAAQSGNAAKLPELANSFLVHSAREVSSIIAAWMLTWQVSGNGWQ